MSESSPENRPEIEPGSAELLAAVETYCGHYLPAADQQEIHEAFHQALADVEGDLDNLLGFVMGLSSYLGVDFDHFLEFLRDEGLLEAIHRQKPEEIP